MTQVKVLAAWGPTLQFELGGVKIALSVEKTAEIELNEKKKGLDNMIKSFNEKRRQRVLDLLKHDEKSICTMHRLIFPEDTPDQWVDHVVMVKIYKYWTETYRIDDSEPSFSNQSSEYAATVCPKCKQVSLNGFSDQKGNRYRLKNYIDPNEELQGKLIANVIDVISEKCFGMPVVTRENAQSL